jgi:hypothetical protein
LLADQGERLVDIASIKADQCFVPQRRLKAITVAPFPAEPLLFAVER